MTYPALRDTLTLWDVSHTIGEIDISTGNPYRVAVTAYRAMLEYSVALCRDLKHEYGMPYDASTAIARGAQKAGEKAGVRNRR